MIYFTKMFKFKNKRTVNLLITIIFLLLFMLFPSFKVFADAFYPGNIYKCEFGFATGIQYKNIDSNINYDNTLLQGNNRDWIQSTPVKNITDVNNLYGKRYDVGNSVAVPPNTQIEIGYWAYNNTHHWVDVKGIDLFTSRSNLGEGDTTRLGTSGIYGTTCDTQWNSYCRTGKKISFSRQDGYPYDTSGNNLGKIFYSFNTIQPIQNVNFIATPIWNGTNLTIKYDLTLKNISSYDLCNILIEDDFISGNKYQNNICITNGQITTLEFTDNMGTNYPNKLQNTITIKDNNTHYESFARGKTGEYDINPETRNAFVRRNDLDHNSNPNWTGSQPGWAGQGFDNLSLKLIPYWFNNKLSLDLSPNVNVTKSVSDLDENNVISSTTNNREVLTYNITINNNGGKTSGMQIIDTFDSSLIDILNADGGIIKNNTIIWNKDLGHSETANYIIKAKVKNLFQGNYLIANKVKTINPESNEAKVVSNVSTNGIIQLNKTLTDFLVTKSKVNSIQLDDPSLEKRKIHFDLTYNNSGSSNAHNVILIDNLDEFYKTYLIDSIQNISDNGVYDINTHSIKWFINNLSYSTSGVQSFDLYLKRSASSNFDVKNIATLTSNETLPKQDSTLSHLLTPKIQIVKKVDKDIVTIGDYINYSIVINNLGKGNAYNLLITDALPVGIQIITDSIIPNNFTLQNNVLSWNISELDGNQSLTFGFKSKISIVNVQDNQNIINIASLTSATIPVINSSTNSEIICGSIGGTVWEDLNRNAFIDSNEPRISNANIIIVISDLNNYTASLLTDSNGQYLLNCLPYNKIIKVNIVKPSIYDGQTTVNQYNITLSSSNIPIYQSIDQTNTFMTINAMKRFNHADLGLYRINHQMSQTGDNLVNLILFLIMLSSILIILKDKNQTLNKKL